jgi:hypothetical protein
MTRYQKNKLLIISVFSLIFLLVFYNYSENGRYTKSGGDKASVFDTRTGTIYSISTSNYIKIKDFKKAKKKSQNEPKPQTLDVR